MIVENLKKLKEKPNSNINTQEYNRRMKKFQECNNTFQLLKKEYDALVIKDAVSKTKFI